MECIITPKKQENMIEKKFTPKRTICKVTFTVPADWAEKEIAVVGDFNEWDVKANKMARKNGGWETEIRFTPETETKFRYFIDGKRWANDDNADGYLPNAYGTEDSVLKVGK